MAAAPLSRYKGSACFVTVHSTPLGGARRPAGEETRTHAPGGRPRAGPPHSSSWKGEISMRLPRGPKADRPLTPTCSSPSTPRIPPLAVLSAQPDPFGEHVCVPHSRCLTFGTQRIRLWSLQIVSNRWGLGDQFSAGVTLVPASSLVALGRFLTTTSLTRSRCLPPHSRACSRPRGSSPHAEAGSYLCDPKDQQVPHTLSPSYQTCLHVHSHP